MEDDFVNGLYPKKPNKDFVKATFGLRKDQFTDFMRGALQNKELWKKDKNGNNIVAMDLFVPLNFDIIGEGKMHYWSSMIEFK